MLQVFVYEVEDIDASSWRAEIAVVASSRSAAWSRLRERGLHKKQAGNDGRPVRQESLAAFPALSDDGAQLLRRRHDDDGWTCWAPVPQHASLDWRVSGSNRRG